MLVSVPVGVRVIVVGRGSAAVGVGARVRVGVLGAVAVAVPQPPSGSKSTIAALIPSGYAGPLAPGVAGSRSRFRESALRATMMLDPAIVIAAISGRRVRPQGAKTPAAIGRASEL